MLNFGYVDRVFSDGRWLNRPVLLQGAPTTGATPAGDTTGGLSTTSAGTALTAPAPAAASWVGGAVVVAAVLGFLWFFDA